MKNTHQLLTEIINHLQKLADELGEEQQKEQHGQTWDAAIKTHDNFVDIHARSWCDFDDYWEEFKTKTNK